MEVIREYPENKEELNNYVASTECSRITLYYEVGYIMFNGEYDEMILYTDQGEISEFTDLFMVNDDFGLEWCGEVFDLDCFGVKV